MGVPYNTAGVAQFLGALPLNIAREMFFTADPVAAERLAQLGVVNRLVDTADDLVPAAWDLAKTIALRAPLAVRAIKAEVTALMSARALTSEEFEWLTSLRRAAWRSSDYVEGIAAFEERRSPDFQGR
jgi:methylmalonyl-CoA decarboxylase